jgi:hypothetical protein
MAQFEYGEPKQLSFYQNGPNHPLLWLGYVSANSRASDFVNFVAVSLRNSGCAGS